MTGLSGTPSPTAAFRVNASVRRARECAGGSAAHSFDGVGDGQRPTQPGSPTASSDVVGMACAALGGVADRTCQLDQLASSCADPHWPSPSIGGTSVPDRFASMGVAAGNAVAIPAPSMRRVVSWIPHIGSIQ